MVEHPREQRRRLVVEHGGQDAFRKLQNHHVVRMVAECLGRFEADKPSADDQHSARASGGMGTDARFVHGACAASASSRERNVNTLSLPEIPSMGGTNGTLPVASKHFP